MRIGIDIGGTNTVWGLVNDHAEILAEGKISTQAIDDFSAYCQALFNDIKSTLSADAFSAFIGIGVGAPNGNFHSGKIEFAPNLPWKGKLPLAENLQKLFSRPCKISNDANAAALGEMKFGVAKDYKDFIMVTLGTGLGSGFVCNGQLVYGHDGLAGELGHVIAVRNGRACGCGRKGCLETYASATGIVRTAKEFLNTNPNSILHNMASLKSADIFFAAEKGDSLALEIFDFTGKILGQCLADAVAITSPNLIVLFGGLAEAGDYILKPTKKYMEENLLKIYQNKVTISLSALVSNRAAILGAAALID